MKKILTLVAALSLVASLAIGGSIAYLQDTDEAVNVMTVGSVYIEQYEQERDADGFLVDFKQGKPALPAVGDTAWNEEGVDVNGTEYKVFSDDLKNVIDKIVTVKNTGKSDAFVRTIIAIEAPDGDPDNLIHVNVNGTGLTYTSWEPVKINGVDYVISTFTYDEALAPDEISAPSLMQVFLDKATNNEDVAKFGDTWEIFVVSQAVQAAGFEDAETALNEAFGTVSATSHPWIDMEDPTDENDQEPDGTTIPTVVSTADELKTALKAGGSVILANNIKIDSGIAPADGTILDLNGHTITDASTGGRTLGAQNGASITITGDGTIEKDPSVSSTYAMPLYISSGTATVNGGTFNMGTPSETNYNILLQNSGKLIINDGTFTNTANYPLFYVIYSSTLEINGGFFESIGTENPDLLDLEYHATRISTITIKGGTFVNYNPQNDNEGDRVVVAAGYKVVSETQADGDIWYTVVPE